MLYLRYNQSLDIYFDLSTHNLRFRISDRLESFSRRSRRRIYRFWIPLFLEGQKTVCDETESNGILPCSYRLVLRRASIKLPRGGKAPA